MRTKIGLIGCGNMGQAILAGLAKNAKRDLRVVAASDADASRRESAYKKFKVETTADNKKVVLSSDIIIIAVKPKDVKALLENDVVSVISGKKIIISIAAGLTTSSIESIVGKNIPVIRVMPNMAAVIGEAISSISAGHSATKAEMKIANAIFSAIGEVIEIDEGMVDALTAISGSGPAYFFFLMEALAEVAEELGLDAKMARKIVLKTALGSAKIVEALNEDASTLRAKVTSKGGTTEAAFSVLQDRKVKEAFKTAVKRACERSRALSKLL